MNAELDRFILDIGTRQLGQLVMHACPYSDFEYAMHLCDGHRTAPEFGRESYTCRISDRLLSLMTDTLGSSLFAARA